MKRRHSPTSRARFGVGTVKRYARAMCPHCGHSVAAMPVRRKHGKSFLYRRHIHETSSHCPGSRQVVLADAVFDYHEAIAAGTYADA